MKPIIDVSIPCIIIPAKTGVIYANQVGGYACHQIEIEGYIIPLSPYFFVKVKENEKSNNPDNPYWNKHDLQEHFDKLFAPLKQDTKYNGHGYDGIDEEDAEYIEKAIGKDDFMEIQVDRNMLTECEEAKIYVKIKLSQYDEHCKEMKPLITEGILTWENSD
jgi:hypothetical protein